MSSDDLAARNSGGQLRLLGTCWVIYGILCLVVGVLLIIYSGTATVMFGALLARVPDPYTLMALFHFVYTLLVVLAFIRGVLGIWAGLTVLAGRTAGRTLALIAGFLSLYDIPLGTSLGIWTLVLFLR